MHPILPVETWQYCREPGYVEEFRARTGEFYQQALEEAWGNLREIETWKHALEAEHTSILALLTSYYSSALDDLSTLKVHLEAIISQGIAEMRETVYDPHPILQTYIGSRLRFYEKGCLKLVTCHRDFSQMLREVREIVRSSSVIVELRGGEGPEQAHWGSESKPVIVAERQENNLPGTEAYAGERNKKGQKHGYGKMTLSDGRTVEGNWRKNKAKGRRKYCYSDGSFYVGEGEWAERGGGGRRKGPTKHVGGLLLVTILASMALGGYLSAQKDGALSDTSGLSFPFPSIPSLDSALSPYSLGPQNTTEGLYSGRWLHSLKTGKGKLTYTDGSEYFGDWSYNLKHGYGVLTYPGNKSWYRGEWANDVRHGFGVAQDEVRAEGSVRRELYVGMFERGARTGLGAVFWDGEPVFLGDWEEDKKSGVGLYREDSTLCFGHFVYSLLHGDATCLYPSGVAYTGQYINGHRSGPGNASYPSESFTGLWLRDNPHIGNFTYNSAFKQEFEARTAPANETVSEKDCKTVPCRLAFAHITGSRPILHHSSTWLTSKLKIITPEGVYSGQVDADGKRSGLGLQLYDEGFAYLGYWHNDTRHGKGKFVDSDGWMWHGDWANDVFSGFGVYNDSTRSLIGMWEDWRISGFAVEENRFWGYEFVGRMQNGSYSGFGAQMDKSGRAMMGDWRGSKLNGPGVILRGTPGQTFEAELGSYESNVLTGYGVHIWPNGSFYSGLYSKGRRSGFGVFSDSAGWFSGDWSNDKRQGAGQCRQWGQPQPCEFENGNRIK